MNDLHGTALLSGHPLSAPELLGAAGIGDLRERAESLLQTIRRARRRRRLLSERVVDRLDHVEHAVLTGVGEILDDLAGIPAEGEPLSSANPAAHYTISAAGCWVWQGSCDGRGIPVVGRRTKNAENAAPRIFYMLLNGPVSDGDVVVRTCSHRRCVNPHHAARRSRADFHRQQASSKLTVDDVREIRNEYARGARVVDLAARFAVVPRYLSQVLANEFWVDPDYIRGCPLEGATIHNGPQRRAAHAGGDYRIDRASGCWVWLRGLVKNAPIVFVGGRQKPGARAYWEAANGPLGSTSSVARTCDNRLCVNPHHGRVVARHHHLDGRRLRADVSRAAEETRAQALAELRPLIEQARREIAEDTANGRALWLARSLDAPLGDGGSTAYAIVAADGGDPVEEIQRAAMMSMLDGFDEETIANLDDEALLDLRERLLAAGFAPSTSMAVA